jgi:hypoxanthine phosphoribosyltransferase
MMDTIKYSWQELETDVRVIADKVDAAQFKPDMIVGIMRGGMIPAVMLSHKMNIPVMSLYWSKRDCQQREFGVYLDTIVKDAVKGRRFLIVDDICDSGETISELQHYASKLSHVKYYSNYIKFATLIYNQDQPIDVDFYGRLISRNEEKRWFDFPFEIK